VLVFVEKGFSKGYNYGEHIQTVPKRREPNGRTDRCKRSRKALRSVKKRPYTPMLRWANLPFIELTPRNYRFTREDVEEFLQKQRKVMRKDEQTK